MFFNTHQNRKGVDVTMYNLRDASDAWMMLMALSDINQEMLDKLEKDHKEEFSQDKKEIVGLKKQRYIALKVIKLLKQTYKELDDAWNR